MFNFRLETVRKLRAAVRDERRGHLAKALQAEAQLQVHDRQLESQQQQLRRETRTAAEPGLVDVDRLIDHSRQQWLLEAQRRELTVQRQDVAREIEKRRAALVEADRELRVLDRLKERKLEEYQQIQTRHEQLVLDEIAGQQWQRKERS